MKFSSPLSARFLLLLAFASAGLAAIAAIWAYPIQSQRTLDRMGIGDAATRLAADVSELATAAAPLLARLGVGDRPADESAPEEPAPEPSSTPPPATPRPTRGMAAPASAPAEQPGPPMSHPAGFVPGYVPGDDELTLPDVAAVTPSQGAASSTSADGPTRPGKVPAWLFDERVYSSQDFGVVPPRPLQPLLPADAPRGVDPNQLGIVEFVVDQAGDVEVVTLVRGVGSVNESSLLAVIKAWRFEPAMKDGLPVKFRQAILLTY